MVVLLGLGPQYCEDLLDGVGEIERSGHQFQPAGFDTGEVQNVLMIRNSDSAQSDAVCV